MSYVLSSELADNFVVGASPHPSITLEQAFKGKPVDLISKVKKPLLFLPAQVHHNLKFSVMRIVFSFSNFFSVFEYFSCFEKQNDPDIYREGGELFETLLINHPTSVTIDFPTVTHGWVLL